MVRSLRGKTLFITGASRGIGKAIGLRAARDGANVVVLGKTEDPDPRLPGTIYTAAEEIVAAGGKALPIATDIRYIDQVQDAVQQAVDRFGGIDVLVNNASAIHLSGTLDTPMKRFDLMHQVNVRGTFLCSQACLPHLLSAANPHVLNIAPPLNFQAKWFAPHLAYSIAKYGMSLCVLGMAEEFRGRVAVDALWPRTVIATSVVRNLAGDAFAGGARMPSIMADAAHAILTRPAADGGGNFYLDEDVLRAEGVTDFEKYAVDPSQDLMEDFFL
jgi:citronellol/citronellal dehydrogenase